MLLKIDNEIFRVAWVCHLKQTMDGAIACIQQNCAYLNICVPEAGIKAGGK